MSGSGRPMKKGKRVHTSAVQRDGPGTSQQERQVEQASSNGERHQSPQPVLRMGGTSRHEEEAVRRELPRKRGASSPSKKATPAKRNRGEDHSGEDTVKIVNEEGRDQLGEEAGTGADKGEEDQLGEEAETGADEGGEDQLGEKAGLFLGPSRSDCRSNGSHTLQWNNTTFTCTKCNERRRYEAKDLDEDKCSRFIEKRINNANYCCRILSATEKPGTRFDVPILSELPPVPYLEKIIGVFSNIGGFDILTFIMIVHEYTGVLSKKNKTVHIHFLDSVSLKEKKPEEERPTRPRRGVPKKLTVNQVILRSYCLYAASVGFETIHFYAKPPRQGDDYLFHRHPPHQKYHDTHKGLIEWYSTGLNCKGVVRVKHEGLICEESDRLVDVLDRHCYEHGFYPSEMKEKLKNIAVVDEARTLEDLKKHFKGYKDPLFFLKLEKPEKMEQAKEVFFPSSFVNGNFLENQRLKALRFDSLESAQHATQRIVHLLVLERNECPIQVELTEKENKIVAPRVLLPGNLQIVPPAQDPKASSSAKNEDGPQSSHPDLRVDGTSSNEVAAAMSHSLTPVYAQNPSDDERMDVDCGSSESGVAIDECEHEAEAMEIDDEEDESVKSTSALKASDPVSLVSPVPEKDGSIKEVAVQDKPTISACQNPASSTVRELKNGNDQMDMDMEVHLNDSLGRPLMDDPDTEEFPPASSLAPILHVRQVVATAAVEAGSVAPVSSELDMPAPVLAELAKPRPPTPMVAPTAAVEAAPVVRASREPTVSPPPASRPELVPALMPAAPAAPAPVQNLRNQNRSASPKEYRQIGPYRLRPSPPSVLAPPSRMRKTATIKKAVARVAQVRRAPRGRLTQDQVRDKLRREREEAARKTVTQNEKRQERATKRLAAKD
ncbi:hypothetical protein CAEBREN_21317 [Caenorhabditis brenneri]|uniref:histone acetyltransferase n=1 Tax=Caenorhabditis brenneri TaxID=135651 RepID=G0NL18_CAEBE|nr:hypothetical protein CAEBREN_21317 [Caenorhabditis brenneri]